MVEILAEILKTELSTLNFVDKITGLVFTLSVKDKEKIRKIPVDVNENTTVCNTETLTDLVPNSSRKSIIYFEDEGTNLLESNKRSNHFESNLNLICWINIKKINKTFSDNSLILAALIQAIPKRLDNQDFITGIKINIDGVIEKENLFNRYDYDEVTTQFMTYPYDAIGLKLNVKYFVSNSCISDVALNDTSC